MVVLSGQVLTFQIMFPETLGNLAVLMCGQLNFSIYSGHVLNLLTLFLISSAKNWETSDFTDLFQGTIFD